MTFPISSISSLSSIIFKKSEWGKDHGIKLHWEQGCENVSECSCLKTKALVIGIINHSVVSQLKGKKNKTMKLMHLI